MVGARMRLSELVGVMAYDEAMRVERKAGGIFAFHCKDCERRYR